MQKLEEQTLTCTVKGSEFSDVKTLEQEAAADEDEKTKGRYRFSYVAYRPGPYTVSVVLDSAHIAQSPFSLELDAAAW